MKTYTIKGFLGHWPVGTSAVVVADDRDEAALLLEAELARIGLSQKINRDDLECISQAEPRAIILNDGDY